MKTKLGSTSPTESTREGGRSQRSPTETTKNRAKLLPASWPPCYLSNDLAPLTRLPRHENATLCFTCALLITMIKEEGAEKGKLPCGVGGGQRTETVAVHGRERLAPSSSDLFFVLFPSCQARDAAATTSPWRVAAGLQDPQLKGRAHRETATHPTKPHCAPHQPKTPQHPKRSRRGERKKTKTKRRDQCDQGAASLTENHRSCQQLVLPRFAVTWRPEEGDYPGIENDAANDTRGFRCRFPEV